MKTGARGKNARRTAAATTRISVSARASGWERSVRSIADIKRAATRSVTIRKRKATWQVGTLSVVSLCTARVKDANTVRRSALHVCCAGEVASALNLEISQRNRGVISQVTRHGWSR